MWRITKWCHFEQHELNGRDEGRDVGESKSISPVLNPHCLKAFVKMTGEMNVFLFNNYNEIKYGRKGIDL